MMPFFQDFGGAIDGYFNSGFDTDKEDIDDSYADVRLYSHAKLTDALSSTAERFFNFTQTFPCSYELTQLTNLTFSVKFEDTEELTFLFTKENQSLLIDIASNFYGNFTSFRLAMYFSIPPTSGPIKMYDVGVFSDFDLYMGSGIVLWKNRHERAMTYNTDLPTYFLSDLTVSSSFLIIILSAIGIVLEVISLIRFYLYCRKKAVSERAKPSVVFKEKLDSWEFIVIGINIFDIICVTLYFVYGDNINETLPWQLFCLAFSSFAHCFIMFRYLSLIPSILIVVRMLKGAIIKLLQFLVGCVPIFFGYVFVGCSMFGWYCPHYTSPRQAAKLLISSSYGDYLLDGYDDMDRGADIPNMIPSAFLTSWIFQALCIWFYIVLSIFNESLVKEVYIAHEEGAEGGEEKDEDPLPWLQFHADL